MKTLLFILSLSISFLSGGQALKKYTIGNSGCSLYSYCVPGFTTDYSEDSSKVYAGECELAGVTYGVICIKLLTEVSDLKNAVELMISYLAHLKTSFNIIRSAGYGYGHKVKDRDDTRGVIDYWTDNAGAQWKIKSYTDGKFIGFLYAYSKQVLNEAKVNVYLDSFRLPVKPR